MKLSEVSFLSLRVSVASAQELVTANTAFILKLLVKHVIRTKICKTN